MICGGTEACVTPMGIGGFAAMRAFSTRNDDPLRASRPWDKDRDGFVVGEGAGILVIEELEFARRARRSDSGRSGRLRHERRCLPRDRAARRRRRRLSRDAQCHARCQNRAAPDRLHQRPRHVHRMWATAPKQPPSSGPSASTPIRWRSAPPSRMTGHLLGGAGGLEAGITVLAIRDQVAPPTINLDNPDRGLRSGLCAAYTRVP